MKSIAIEREFGSGGREIGMKTAELAGIPYYDSNLMVEAGKNFNIPLDLLKEFDEQRTGSILYNLAMFTGYNRTENIQKVQELYYGMEETIHRLARLGPAVFIGRCCTEILKSETEVYSVYIYSSDTDKKIKRIMEAEQVGELEARRMMERKDRQRRTYFHHWTEKEWGDKKNYDLELNTARLSTDECAAILLQMAGK